MALIKPDRSEISARLKPGVYRARVQRIEPYTTQKGKSAINVFWETAGNSDPNNNGGQVRQLVMMEGKGAFRFDEIIEAFTGEEYKGEPVESEKLVGREAELVLAWQVDQDQKVSDKWTQVESVGRVQK